MRLKYKNRHHFVHSIVCTAFHGDHLPGHTVDHIDRSPQNNHPDNLRWVSAKEQANNRSTVLKVRGYRGAECIGEWPSMTLAAQALGLAVSTVSQAVTKGGLWWRHSF